MVSVRVMKVPTSLNKPSSSAAVEVSVKVLKLATVPSVT